MTDTAFLKDSVDLASLIEQETGREFKKLGRNLVTLCPFHKETTPSFTVFPDGHYMCFGCGRRGDQIEFIMAYKSLDFCEAVKELREFAEAGPSE